MKISPYLFLDFETGGLDAKVNPITEIALVATQGDNFKEIARYHALVYPYKDEIYYEDQALNVTGISLELLYTEGKKIETVISELNEFLKQINIHNERKYRPVIVGHNIAFDINFLFALIDLGLNIKAKGGAKPDYLLDGSIDYYGNFQPRTMDTLKLAMQKWGNDPTITSYKLKNCVDKASLVLDGAHRALNDTLATKELFKYFSIAMRDNNSGNSTSNEATSRPRTSFKIGPPN